MAGEQVPAKAGARDLPVAKSNPSYRRSHSVCTNPPVGDIDGELKAGIGFESRSPQVAPYAPVAIEVSVGAHLWAISMMNLKQVLALKADRPQVGSYVVVAI
jgi:hypothetical protein